MNLSPPPKAKWIEIVIRIHPAAHESLSAFLFDLGCTGVVTQDFKDRSIRAYLPFEKDLEETRNRLSIFLLDLKDIFPEVQEPEWSLGAMEEEDWSSNWKRFFRTERATENLTIVPAWEPFPPQTSGRAMRIDPGPAFGTGQHPTTRMCLEAMERLDWTEPAGMLDVGTGSGILAIYGAMLGAKRILGIDIDPEALRWAERNLDLNGLKGAVQLSGERLESLRERFSVVTANLILKTILDLAPAFPPVLAPGGKLILSGILREQVGAVVEEMKKHRLAERETLYLEEWACVIVGRTP